MASKDPSPPLISTYDNAWELTVAPNPDIDAAAVAEACRRTPGVFLGNGKVGYVTALHKIGVQKSLLAVNFALNDHGSYANNVIDAFDATTIRFFDVANETSLSVVRQSLDMYAGMCRTSFVARNPLPVSDETFDVECQLFPIRHLPYSTLMSVSITPRQFTQSLDVYHLMSCLPNMQNVQYNNNVIYAPHRGSDEKAEGVYMLHGTGTVSGKEGTQVAACCTYVFERQQACTMAPVGFNKFASNPLTCFQKIRLGRLLTGQTYTFHIITTQMSDMDFRLPIEETKRILLSVSADVAKIRNGHVHAWMNTWKHNVVIEPRPTAPPEDRDDVGRVNRVLRYSLYNVWSSVREGTNVELGPVIDTVGNLFWDGDLWYIPVLLIFRPHIARNVLETRYAMLEKAMRLASGYGYEGSKFPAANDVVGYDTNPYWDAGSSMHIFNTALISMNVWNYYRVTLDKNWMVNKGYAILKNNADFFASRIEVDDDTGTYHIRNVVSINNEPADDNALTNYLAKAAFLCAIEASYELQMYVNPDWIMCFHNIDLPMKDGGGAIVDPGAAPSSKYLEHLIPLLPLYSEVLYKQNPQLDPRKVVLANLEASSVPTPADADAPFNSILTAWLNGSTHADVDAFSAALSRVLTTNALGVWGNFDALNRDNALNDVSLCAMFVLMIATTAGGVRLSGNVTDTRFYTERMGIRVVPTCPMPATWRSVKLSGVGSTKAAYNVMNTI